MKRKQILWLGGGVGLGVLLGLLMGFWLFRAPAAPEALTSPSPSLLVSSSPAPIPVETAAGTWRAWDREAVYNGGDEVLYQGRIYRAKWWSQGEPPGQADVWEDTLQTPGPSVSAPPATPAPAGTPIEKPAGFKVVGYYPDWKPDDTGKPRWDVLTHLNYAFAIPTAEGGLRPLEHPETARQLIQTAHDRGVQVLLAVGGWSYQEVPLEPTFVSATATAEKRDAFAGAIVDMCLEYGFDGVDMDWEHPRVDGPSGGQYEALMVDLSARLHGEGKLLTSAVLSGATADGNIYYDAAAHSDAVLDAVDWINVMAYDGGDGARHSSYDFAVDCGAYWRENRGMDAEKVVLGLPFYARPSWAGYGDLLAAVPEAAEGDRVDYNGMEVWYNGPGTIADKTRYAMDRLGGVMIWEVTQDADSAEKGLQEAIGRALMEAK